MANVFNLASCVLCILCIATMSECTKTPGKKMLNSWPDSTHHRLDVWDISHGYYSSCRQFFKREICDECFLEDHRVLSALPSHRGNSASQREAPAAPATIKELTRTGSELVSKLERGACALGRPSSSGRSRRSIAMDVGSIDASSFVEAIYEKYGTSGVISEDQFESLLQDLGIGKPLAPSVETNQLSSVTNNASIQQCFLADDLLEIFNASNGITEKMFASVCPSLIQQITRGCVAPVTPPKTLDPLMYAWATLAVVSITALSMLAMIAVPTHGSRFYAAVMQLFVALAVSSLSGDALLHLLPEALGIHGMTSNVDQPNHILIILTIILAIYFFFIFERVISLCLKGTSYGHGHVHSRPRRETFIEDDGCAETHLDHHEHNNTERGKDENQDDDHDTISNKEVIDEKTSKGNKLDKDEEADFELKKPELKICGLNKLSVMVLIGDAVHNITDGITIGVSFVNGPYVGASTTIAVFFHEVPHEIGDFAVMLRSGVSFRKAMLCSLISNLVGFVGLYAGLLLGSENNVQRWIFAATAGMFLYIALVSLVPEMNQQAEEAVNPWRAFLRHNIGLILGWAIMLALGINEQVADHLN